MLTIDFKGKTALITGGGNGIGRELCQQFSMAGAHVVCVDINSDGVAETVDCIEQSGGKAIGLTADVTDSRAVQSYVRGTIAAFKRIDMFVNNAGYQGVVRPIVDYPEEIFDRVISINVKGVFLGLKYVLPVMIKQLSGVVVNIGSVGSFIGAPSVSAYTSSKHAVLGLTRTAALEVAKQGIRVNAVCPGGTNTKMIRALDADMEPNSAKRALEDIPDGRRGEPKEVARAVIYLASDLSTHITGQSLIIDGGRLVS